MFWHQNDGKNCLLSANLSFVPFGLTQGPLGGIFRQAFNLVPVFSNKHTVTDAIFVDNVPWLWEDPRSNKHYLSSSENKAWKKFRPVLDLNPWPLRYRCSAFLITAVFVFNIIKSLSFSPCQLLLNRVLSHLPNLSSAWNPLISVAVFCVEAACLILIRR